ncbi:MAG: hypothetical protein LBI72_06760 [Flavobacteriaceae bacterium]|nr:hypothetical protein [Flavobacteriaceae bacterium]
MVVALGVPISNLIYQGFKRLYSLKDDLGDLRHLNIQEVPSLINPLS